MAGPDLRVLRRCVGFCERAYGESSLHSELAHCLVVWSGDRSEVAIAFRGSVHARDWLTDFDVRRADQGICTLHAGFLAAARSIVDQVARIDQREVKARLTITGHSLGGAVAVIVAWLLSARGWRADLVVTFGGPRVGDGAWRRCYQAALGERTWRVVNGEDIVCRVPSWFTGWRHVGSELFIPMMGPAVVRPWLALKLLSDLGGTYRDYTEGRVAQLADHGMDQYSRAVGAL